MPATSIPLTTLALAMFLAFPSSPALSFAPFACSSALRHFSSRSIRSLDRSLNRSKCSRMTMVYLTNSSMQSTTLSRFPEGFNRLPPSLSTYAAASESSVASVNWVYAFGCSSQLKGVWKQSGQVSRTMDDWLVIVNLDKGQPAVPTWCLGMDGGSEHQIIHPHPSSQYSQHIDRVERL